MEKLTNLNGLSFITVGEIIDELELDNYIDSYPNIKKFINDNRVKILKNDVIFFKLSDLENLKQDYTELSILFDKEYTWSDFVQCYYYDDYGKCPVEADITQEIEVDDKKFIDIFSEYVFNIDKLFNNDDIHDNLRKIEKECYAYIAIHKVQNIINNLKHIERQDKEIRFDWGVIGIRN